MKKLLFAAIGMMALFMLTCQIENLHELAEYKEVIARFEHSADGCSAPCPITFENRSTNGAFYLWDFGDGYTSTETNPVHEYTKSGSYLVRLTAFELSGQKSAVDSAFININFLVDFEIQNDGCTAPCLVSLKNQSDLAAAYEWDFGDGFRDTTYSQQASPVPHRFLGGTFTITLTARTETGEAFSKTKVASILFNTFEKRIISTKKRFPKQIFQLENNGYLVFGNSSGNNVYYGDAFLATFSETGDQVQMVESLPFTGLGLTSYIDDEFYYAANAQDNPQQTGFQMGITNSSGHLYRADPAQASLPRGTYELYDAIPILPNIGRGSIGFGFLGEGLPVSFTASDITFMYNCDNNSKAVVGRKLYNQPTSVYCVGNFDPFIGYGTMAEFTKIISTSDETVVAVGRSWEETPNNFGPLYDYNTFLVKLDRRGDAVFTDLGGSFEASIYDVQLAMDGGFIVGGGRGHQEFEGSSRVLIASYMQLIKTDSDGNVVWVNRYDNGPTLYEEFSTIKSVKPTPDGGYIAAGDTQQRDIILIKTDAAGELQWHRRFSGRHRRSAIEVIGTSDGGYMVLGSLDSRAPGEIFRTDPLLIKTDADGYIN